MQLWPRENCPRCGSDNLEIRDNATAGRYWYVVCLDCGLQNDYGRLSQHEACVSWDMRAKKWRMKDAVHN